MTVVAHRGGLVRPPGPRLGTIRLVRRVRRDGALAFVDGIAAEYPRLAYFRLGTEHAYLVFEPDLSRTLLVDAGRATAKGRGLERAKELLGEGLLTSEGDLHRRQRRLVQPAFSPERIARYATVMVDESAALSAGWRDGAQVDMHAEMSRLTLRIAGRTLFGTELPQADLDLVAASLRTFLGSFLTRMLPIGALLGRLPTPGNRRLHRAGADLDGLVARLVAEHRAAGDSGDLLSMLLLAQEGGAGMSDRQVRDEVLTLLLAGHETTANALSWAWLLLARSPDAAGRLHAELDGLGRPPGPDDLAALTFTRAVAAESIRLRPPSWLVGRRATADLRLDGYTVPAGSLLGTSQWVLHRDPRWWGPDAREFRPDRWLDADGRFDDTAPGQPRGAYVPFGAGRRVCVGEHFAWAEAVLVLATLARDWAPAAVPATSDAGRAAVTLRPVAAPLHLRRRS